jgi:hypothetical protein
MKKQKYYFNDLLNDGFIYHNFSRVNNNGAKGWRYVLNKPITEAQRERLSQYKNVIFGTCYYKYDVRQSWDCIVIFDKKIKA